jgi:hypothetical protein
MKNLLPFSRNHEEQASVPEAQWALYDYLAEEIDPSIQASEEAIKVEAPELMPDKSAPVVSIEEERAKRNRVQSSIAPDVVMGAAAQDQARIAELTRIANREAPSYERAA